MVDIAGRSTSRAPMPSPPSRGRHQVAAPPSVANFVAGYFLRRGECDGLCASWCSPRRGRCDLRSAFWCRQWAALLIRSENDPILDVEEERSLAQPVSSREVFVPQLDHRTHVWALKLADELDMLDKFVDADC